MESSLKGIYALQFSKSSLKYFDFLTMFKNKIKYLKRKLAYGVGKNRPSHIKKSAFKLLSCQFQDPQLLKSRFAQLCRVFLTGKNEENIVSSKRRFRKRFYSNLSEV